MTAAARRRRSSLPPLLAGYCLIKQRLHSHRQRHAITWLASGWVYVALFIGPMSASQELMELLFSSVKTAPCGGHRGVLHPTEPLSVCMEKSENVQKTYRS